MKLNFRYGFRSVLGQIFRVLIFVGILFYINNPSDFSFEGNSLKPLALIVGIVGFFLIRLTSKRKK